MHQVLAAAAAAGLPAAFAVDWLLSEIQLLLLLLLLRRQYRQGPPLCAVGACGDKAAQTISC
jgi:hypothetical protein